MISKSNAKFIKSLQLKKYRKVEQAFLVEGAKSVLETLKSDFEVLAAATTVNFLNDNDELSQVNTIYEVNERELSALGTFKSNNTALLVVKMKPNVPFSIKKGFTLALDDINDPGNLGAIIRIANWYGIQNIVASEDTVDLYNPKVIAASKGSFNRVNLYYTDLEKYLKTENKPTFGALMEGESIHNIQLPDTGIIVMGNEANGISSKIQEYIHHKVTIPKFGQAESLNVAMATAIICDNVMRVSTSDPK